MVDTPSDASPTVVGEPASVETPVEDAPAAVGATLGRYAILEEVGRGGMGRVLRAYDPKLQREVALKEVRRSLLGSDGAVRLVAEARAMAKLSHPNVVAVYDVETLQGRVVIAMEYVPGTTLREWLRAEKRAWRDVVRRFVQAGRGLAAAHGAQLLHRDFKPRNVLVSPDHSVVKVTDFGLAKIAGSAADSLPDSSGARDDSEDGLTRPGMVMGTPRYMAPEQHGGAALDASADQFAFCVSLWEALCGEPPFSGEDLLQAKQEGPPRWTRSDVPRIVSDAIGRGLAPVPADRWPDLETLLDQLSGAVSPRQTSSMVALGAVGLVALGATGWAVASGASKKCTGAREQMDPIWGGQRRADVEQSMLGVDVPYAMPVWEDASATLDAYTEAWVDMHTEACEATTVRGEQSVSVMDLRMACLHRAQVDLEVVVDLLASADAQVLRRVRRVLGQLSAVSDCADVDGLLAEAPPPRDEERDAVERARQGLAEVQANTRAGRYPKAQKRLDEVAAVIQEVEYVPVHARYEWARGGLLESMGEFENAAVAAERALELAAKSRDLEMMGSLAAELVYLFGGTLGRPDEAVRYLPMARGLASAPEDRARLASAEGTVFMAQGRYAEAEASFRRAVELRGPDQMDSLQARSNLAMALDEQGKRAESEKESRAVLAMRESTLGPHHPVVGAAYNNLAPTVGAQGRHEEAEQLARRAIEIWEASQGPRGPDVAGALTNLASTLRDQGRQDEAEAADRRALSILLETVGPEHPRVAMVQGNLGNSLFWQKRYDEALIEYEAVLALRERINGTDHPAYAHALSSVASAWEELGRVDEAEAAYRRALGMFETKLGADHPLTAHAHANLASALFRLGRYAEAKPQLERAIELKKSQLPPDHPDLAQARELLQKIDRALAR